MNIAAAIDNPIKRRPALSPEARAQRVNQYATFRQKEWLTRDTRFCDLALLYDATRRFKEAESWRTQAALAAGDLEIDDETTGGDFLTEAMVSVMPADADTAKKIEGMLQWHRFGSAEYEPRLADVVALHLAALSVKANAGGRA